MFTCSSFDCDRSSDCLKRAWFDSLYRGSFCKSAHVYSKKIFFLMAETREMSSSVRSYAVGIIRIKPYQFILWSSKLLTYPEVCVFAFLLQEGHRLPTLNVSNSCLRLRLLTAAGDSAPSHPAGTLSKFFIESKIISTHIRLSSGQLKQTHG